MFPVWIGRLGQKNYVRQLDRFSRRHRILSVLVFTFLLVMITNALKKITWEVQLMMPQNPTQAWMDVREQNLVVKYLQASNRSVSKQGSVMLEYGSGSSTFVFSQYVRRYISIEHDTDYCRLLERMAALQSNRSITVSYMKFDVNRFIETHRFEQNPPKTTATPTIHIYCVPPNAYAPFKGFWKRPKRSTYTLYRDYVNFISIHLPNEIFDFVLIDGRARPQVAYMVLKHLDGLKSKVFFHDWNNRPGYHIIIDEFYNLVNQQRESEQLGGGGLVVLEKKPEVIGKEKIDQLQWRNAKQPDWWI